MQADKAPQALKNNLFIPYIGNGVYEADAVESELDEVTFAWSDVKIVTHKVASEPLKFFLLDLVDQEVWFLDVIINQIGWKINLDPLSQSNIKISDFMSQFPQLRSLNPFLLMELTCHMCLCQAWIKSGHKIRLWFRWRKEKVRNLTNLNAPEIKKSHKGVGPLQPQSLRNIQNNLRSLFQTPKLQLIEKTWKILSCPTFKWWMKMPMQ